MNEFGDSGFLNAERVQVSLNYVLRVAVEAPEPRPSHYENRSTLQSGLNEFCVDADTLES